MGCGGCWVSCCGSWGPGVGLLGRAHIGVTATVYAHVRLHLQRNAIDLLGRTLRESGETTSHPDDGDDPALRAAPVR